MQLILNAVAKVQHHSLFAGLMFNSEFKSDKKNIKHLFATKQLLLILNQIK